MEAKKRINYREKIGKILIILSFYTEEKYCFDYDRHHGGYMFWVTKPGDPGMYLSDILLYYCMKRFSGPKLLSYLEGVLAGEAIEFKKKWLKNKGVK